MDQPTCGKNTPIKRQLAAQLDVSLKIVFDFGGVVFHWQPVDLLQQVLPQRATNAVQGRAWATAIFQGFDPPQRLGAV